MRAIVAASFFSFLLLVTPVFGVGPGDIVPCDGPDCGTCELMQFGSNILAFLVKASILFAGLVFAWGGFKMIISAGEASSISEAKSMMTNSIVGIVIVMSAWLLVDTMIKLVADADTLGVWNEIQCTTQSEAGSPSATARVGVDGGISPSAVVFTPTQSDTSLQQNFKTVTDAYASEIDKACRGTAIPSCRKVVASVIANESQGKTDARSSEGSVGIMQLLPENGGKICSTSDKTCIQDQINKGVGMLDGLYRSDAVNNDISHMLAAYNAGAATEDGQSATGKRPALAASQDCPGLKAYECSINPGGLAETQGYVANICRTLSLNGSSCE